MEKRLFLAIALAILILISWSAFVSKTQHIDIQRFTSNPRPSIPAKPAPEVFAPEKTERTAPLPSLEFSQEKYDILFIESQAAIKEVIFKSYQNHIFPLEYGFLLGDPTLVFQKDSATPERVSFVYRGKDIRIMKQYHFSNSSYNIQLEITIHNVSSSQLNINFPLILGVMDFGGDQSEARLKDVAFAGKEKIMHLNPRKDAFLEQTKFLGLRDRYFCAIIEPSLDNYSSFIKKINAQKAEIGLSPKEFTLGPNQQIKLAFDIYLGPQELRHITSIKPEWGVVMYYGTFDFIAHLVLQVLDFLFGLVHNWGITIIILSLLIYLILFPLTLKQMRSMKQMQTLQPRIEELRRAHKNNPQKLNTEIMGLYREYKVNPFSGCLPLILQIPIFFALYQVLIRSVALKGAKFLWIKDLSSPDRLFILPASLPFIGNEINLLPILMTIGMFVQQKFSMATTSTGSAEQQKLMLILMPLMFGFIFYHMSSGLVLYWFVNSLLMLAYQLRMNLQK